MDKVNPFKVLVVGYVLAFLSLSALGFSAGGPFLLVFATAALCGIFLLAAMQVFSR